MVGWLPGVGLVTVATMVIVLLVAQPVHEPPEAYRITASIDSREESRSVDQPRAGVGAGTRPAGVAAPRAREARFTSPGTRQAAPRGVGPSRTRASRHTGSAAGGPSQAP
jgi:hypothetical protein